MTNLDPTNPDDFDGIQANVLNTGTLNGRFSSMIGMADPNGTWVLDPQYIGDALTLTLRGTTEALSWNGSYYVATGQYLVALADQSCSLDGNGTNGDVLIGQNGNDTFSIDNTNFHLVDGGGGYNILVWENNNAGPVHLTGNGGLVENIQQIELAYSGANLVLSAADVATIADGGPLTITSGQGGDSVALVGVWQTEAGPGGYTAYVSGSDVVDVANTISVTVTSGVTVSASHPDVTVPQPAVVALAFDGSAQMVLNNYASLSTNSGALTYATWIQTTGSSGHEELVDVGNGTGAPGTASCFYLNDGHLQLDWNSVPGSEGSTSVADGRWHYVAVTYDGAGNVAYYVDGQADGGGSISAPDITADFAAFAGSQWSSANFTGEMSGMGIWNVALSQASLQTAMAEGAAAVSGGLLGAWDMNAGSGVVVADSSGNGQDATMTSAESWVTAQTGTVSASVPNSDGIGYTLTGGTVTDNGDGTYSVATAHGTVTLNASTGAYAYVAAVNGGQVHYGLDSFEWQATDTTTGVQSGTETTTEVVVSSVVDLVSGLTSVGDSSYATEEVVVNGATLDIVGDSTLGYVDVHSGSYTDSSSVTETLSYGGLVEANGGTLNLYGTLDTDAGAVVTVAGWLVMAGGTLGANADMVVTGLVQVDDGCGHSGLTVDGILDFDSSGGLSLAALSLAGAGEVINDGLLTLSGTDNIVPTICNDASATLTVATNANLTVSLLDNNGAITGDGTIHGEIYSNGTLAPSGTLTIDGTLALGATSVLNLHESLSGCSSVDVHGALILGGTLDVDYTATSQNHAGDTFVAATMSGSVSGSFDALEGLVTSYEATTWLLDPTITDTSIDFTLRTADMASGGNGYHVAGQDLLAYSTVASTLDGTSNSHDVLIGQGGNDTLIIGDTSFDFLDGGAGTNTLELLTAAASPAFDFTAKQGLAQNIQVVDLTHVANGATIDLNAANVAGLSQGANALVTGVLGAGYGNSVVIFGSAGTSNDNVNLTGAGWSEDAHHPTAIINAESYTVYSNGNAHVLVDGHIIDSNVHFS